MFSHIRGYIKIDDRKIIVHTQILLLRLSNEKIVRLLRSGFPRTFKEHEWMSGHVTIGNDLQNLPTWFNRAIKQADEENDWEVFPYVALEARNGLIELTSFSAI